MRAAQLQQTISILADYITKMHKDYARVRKSRAMYNAEADKLALQGVEADEQLDFDKSHTLAVRMEAYQYNANIFTKDIDALKAKIKRVESLQKQLKGELKHAAAMEAWAAEDDAFWLEQAKVAQEEGFAEPGVVQAFLEQEKIN